MDLSEFRRRLGADPLAQEPEMRAARRAGPEFEAAAAAAERFEARLRDAAALPVPDGLADELARLRTPQPARWWPMALAASLLIAVGAAGFAWKARPAWSSVEEYVIDHYRHDGARAIAQLDASAAPPVDELLTRFRLAADPALADIIGVIKVCPTPNGDGVHLVLNTERGPLTVIYMPGASVTDRARLAFDDVEAMLVEMPGGAAAIIGPRVGDYYAVVHDSLRPLDDGS
jgi:hypothetical protein